MGDISNSILDAIDIITDKKFSDAGFDKTVQATIISCADKTIGKYKVRYQDSYFYAFSTNVDVTYSNNTTVYILVPNGDFNNDKTILGAAKKLGTDYIRIITEDDRFELLGNESVEYSNKISLCSYRTETVVVYDENTSLLSIDDFALEKAMLEGNSLRLGAYIQNKLDIAQRGSGNFGIRYYIQVVSEDANTTTTIPIVFTLDVHKMVGQPYLLTTPTLQTAFCDLTGKTFVKISKIEVFVENFRLQDEEEHEDDIFFSNFTALAARTLEEEEINGVYLSIRTPQGIAYPASDLSQTGSKKLIGEIIVKGEKVDSSVQNIDFYWFVENMRIKENSSVKGYSVYGGAGWKCLNSYQINEGTVQNPSQVTYTPNSTGEINVEKIGCKEVRYKCVAIYNGEQYSRIVTIYNNGDTYDIRVVSDIGEDLIIPSYATLTATVYRGNSIAVEDATSTFYWGAYDNNGNYQTVDATSDSAQIIAQIAALQTQIAELQSELENHSRPSATIESEIALLQEQLARYERVFWVDGRYIHNISAEKIIKFITYKCSAYSASDSYLGTGAITLNNQYVSAGYNLRIVNGQQIFKYDEEGYPPTSTKNDNPITLSELTLSLTDNKGKEIDISSVSASAIKWYVPAENSLLTINKNYDIIEEGTTFDGTGNYNVYSNTYNLVYDLASLYNINKTFNTIYARVEYKDSIITAQTNFTFTKEGEPGTNGTSYFCQIVPNVQSGELFNEYPQITRRLNGATWSAEYNYTKAEGGDFKLNVYDSTELLESGISRVNWSKLTNHYATTYKKDTQGNLITRQETFINAQGEEETTEVYVIESEINDYSSFSSIAEGSSLTLANLTMSNHAGSSTIAFADVSKLADVISVEAVVNGKTLHGSLPINTAYMSTGKDAYKIRLKMGTGFRFVKYLSDGTDPTYSKSLPFEVIVSQYFTSDGVGYWEDVDIDDFSFSFQVCDAIRKKTRTGTSTTWTFENSNPRALTIKNNEELAANQVELVPSKIFKGYATTTALVCTVANKNNLSDIIGLLHIPIYMYINTTGLSSVNGWDGSSISIDEKGGVILAPQIGAGHKDSDNTFTGMVMGDIKETDGSLETGLFGYKKGQRSIFLDANTGKAEFGFTNKGKIIIDPNGDAATITGGKYELRDKTNPQTKPGTGMQINLGTNPSITWGNKNFLVDANGNLTAKNVDLSGTMTTTSSGLTAGLSSGGLHFKVGSTEISTFHSTRWKASEGYDFYGTGVEGESNSKFISFGFKEGSTYVAPFIINHGLGTALNSDAANTSSIKGRTEDVLMPGTTWFGSEFTIMDRITFEDPSGNTPNRYISRYENPDGTYGIYLIGNVCVSGDFNVEGANKNRAVDTEHFGTVLMSAYETSTPYFGEIGKGKCDKDGLCYIFISEIFKEVTIQECEYIVFLQGIGEGNVSLLEQEDSYFIVKGQPFEAFNFEIKARQKGTQNKHFEPITITPAEPYNGLKEKEKI